VSAADMSRETLGRDSETDAVTIPLDVWQRTLDLNLTGFLLCVKATVPRLLERGGGAIVNTISDAAFVGEPIRVGYATTKAALTAVTRHVASAWGTEGIRCNSIAPGLIARDDAMEPTLADRYGPMPRSRRFGRPADIAAAAAFLLSDDGEWVNGQVWSVNGGHVLG
jgi:NAD(P)-dependent dehydrogenase (short-subunit alcohol dehydrogenase family)